ncbi:hypothetical protein AB7W88_19260, partial [Providencia vermicola]
VQTTFGGVCGAKKGGLALHFGLESADNQSAGMMVAPFSDIKYQINQEAKDITWRVMNDFGGESREYHQALKGGEKK